MPPRKKTEGAAPATPGAVAKRETPGSPASAPSTVATASGLTSRSKLPNALRFPLVVLLNLSLSGVLYSVASELVTTDLAEVSRSYDQWWEIATLLSVKLVELSVSWFGGYDSYDLASLTLITHFPVMYLLATFYQIRATTVWASLAIDVASVALPVQLLRPLSAPHAPAAYSRAAVANRLILADPVTQVAASLAAAGAQAVVLQLALRASPLTAVLASRFTGLRTLETAHAAPFFALFAWLLPLGFAAKTFLFVPATAAKPDEVDTRRRHFRPASASFAETVAWNVWGWTHRERELLKRTAVMAALTALHVGARTLVSVAGTDASGAAAWASVWTAAAAVTGAAFWWVGKVDDGKA